MQSYKYSSIIIIQFVIHYHFGFQFFPVWAIPCPLFMQSFCHSFHRSKVFGFSPLWAPSCLFSSMGFVVLFHQQGQDFAYFCQSMSHHVVTTLVIRFILHQPLGMKPLTIFLFTFPSHEELANIQVQSTLAIVLPASSFLVAKVFKCLTCFWMVIFTVCLESTASSLVELADYFLP